MYRLHYFPGNASLAPHMLLRELGADFELVLVDRTTDAHRSAAYRVLNPKGVIPTLEHDGWVLTESAAICAYLADQHAGAPWGSPGDARTRARQLEWLFYLSNTVQPELMLFHYPERRVSGDAACSALRERAAERLGEMFTFLDGELRARPFLLGDTPAAPDLYLLMMVRWARTFAAPPRALANVGRVVTQLLARPAVQATFHAEQLEAPWV